MDLSFEKTPLPQVKLSIINEIDRRFEDNSIEETNANLIKRLVQNAESTNDALMIWNLGTRLTKTGIQFDRNFERVLDEKSTIHYLKRNTKLSFKTDENAPLHKLIIGENFYALKNLLISYRGKIDVIYIDPPYGKDSMGEFAVTNYHNDVSRDNLLTMLEIRLEIAKMLLSDNGVIFCSIDDKNQAYVKCLFDDIFGERNFVATIVRKTKPFDRDKSNRKLQTLFDYILTYTKDMDSMSLKQINCGEREYKFEDNRGEYKLNPLQNSGPHGYRDVRPNTFYPIFLMKDGKFAVEESESTECLKVFLPEKIGTRDGCWSWQKSKILGESDRIVIKDNKLYIKVYKDVEKDNTKYKSYENLLLDFLNSQGSSELTKVGFQDMFSNPKPVSLIKWLINLSSNPSSVVLDFFAGSGTTCQAVQELNNEDGGSRECILVQMDEKTSSTPNGIATDVTAKRLKRVMTGRCYDGSTDFEWIKKNSPISGNLDVYDISEVSVNEGGDGISAFDVIDETIYGCKKFTTLKDKVDWVCSNFSITTSRIGKGNKDA